MTNLCIRCEQPHPLDRMRPVFNSYHNGPKIIDVCDHCLKLGDRIAGTLEVEFDDEDED